jgi:hypothetical protein
VEIGMGEPRSIAAARTVSTRAVFFAAQKLLRDPDCQALLADAARSLQQQACGQFPSPNGVGELFAELLVTIEIDDWHIQIWLRCSKGTGGSHGETPGTFSD